MSIGKGRGGNKQSSVCVSVCVSQRKISIDIL